MKKITRLAIATGLVFSTFALNDVMAKEDHKGSIEIVSKEKIEESYSKQDAHMQGRLLLGYMIHGTTIDEFKSKELYGDIFVHPEKATEFLQVMDKEGFSINTEREFYYEYLDENTKKASKGLSKKGVSWVYQADILLGSNLPYDMSRFYTITLELKEEEEGTLAVENFEFREYEDSLNKIGPSKQEMIEYYFSE